jgi:hypothetical protein
MRTATKLNHTQKLLFNICLHGEKACSDEIKKDLSFADYHKMRNKFRKAQIVINRLKQERINEWANAFMKHFFPKTELTQVFTVQYGDAVDLNKICSMSFKDLGITTEDIIDKLIKSGVLPKNFYGINSDLRENL